MSKRQEINKGESPEIAIKIGPNKKAIQKTTKKIVPNTVKNIQFHSNLKKPTTIWLKAHKNRMETKTKKTSRKDRQVPGMYPLSIHPKLILQNKYLILTKKIHTRKADPKKVTKLQKKSNKN
jgi:hypothetical protein